MSYLSRLDSVLRFKTYNDVMEVNSIIREIIKYENVSMEVESCLIELGLELSCCTYLELDTFTINYTQLLNFLTVGEKLYSYLESIGIE